MTIAFEPGFGIEQAANCVYDKLELFEAGASIGIFCGDGGDAINAGAFSLNGPVRFEFVSDNGVIDNGFSANFDIVSADPCAGVDCSNRGECVEGLCECNPGFVGDFCEVNIDECMDQPCQNGECIDGINLLCASVKPDMKENFAKSILMTVLDFLVKMAELGFAGEFCGETFRFVLK